MAGYWPRAFFAFLWTDTKSRSIKHPPKKRLLSSYLDRTKDLLFRKKLRFIKNKEWYVYFERRKRKPSEESCMFLYFDCLLPLYSTTDTVQKLRTFFKVRSKEFFVVHGISAVYLEWARWAHLARSVSQSEHWIRFILTKGTVSDIIKKSYFKRLTKSPFD